MKFNFFLAATRRPMASRPRKLAPWRRPPVPTPQTWSSSRVPSRTPRLKANWSPWTMRPMMRTVSNRRAPICPHRHQFHQRSRRRSTICSACRHHSVAVKAGHSWIRMEVVDQVVTRLTNDTLILSLHKLYSNSMKQLCCLIPDRSSKANTNNKNNNKQEQLTEEHTTCTQRQPHTHAHSHIYMHIHSTS